MSTLNQIYFWIENIPISVFGYFIIHKLNIQKMGKNKKLIEENFFKLILNIVNFLCCKKIHFSRYYFMPRYVTMATKIFFCVVYKKDRRCYYHKKFLLFKYLLHEYSLVGSNIDKCWLWNIQKNWKIQKIVVAMETVRKIRKFFTFVFITQYKLKMGKVSEKSIFSISKPYCEVSDFLIEWLLNSGY